MLKQLLVLSGILLLSACAQGAKPGDGRDWQEVRCSGFEDWSVCKARALRMCPGGYDAYNMREDLTIQRRSMEVACKK